MIKIETESGIISQKVLEIMITRCGGLRDLTRLLIEYNYDCQIFVQTIKNQDGADQPYDLVFAVVDKKDYRIGEKVILKGAMKHWEGRPQVEEQEILAEDMKDFLILYHQRSAKFLKKAFKRKGGKK